MACAKCQWCLGYNPAMSFSPSRSLTVALHADQSSSALQASGKENLVCVASCSTQHFEGDLVVFSKCQAAPNPVLSWRRDVEPDLLEQQRGPCICHNHRERVFAGLLGRWSLNGNSKALFIPHKFVPVDAEYQPLVRHMEGFRCIAAYFTVFALTL